MLWVYVSRRWISWKLMNECEERNGILITTHYLQDNIINDRRYKLPPISFPFPSLLLPRLRKFTVTCPDQLEINNNNSPWPWWICSLLLLDPKYKRQELNFETTSFALQFTWTNSVQLWNTSNPNYKNLNHFSDTQLHSFIPHTYILYLCG